MSKTQVFGAILLALILIAGCAGTTPQGNGNGNANGTGVYTSIISNFELERATGEADVAAAFASSSNYAYYGGSGGIKRDIGMNAPPGMPTAMPSAEDSAGGQGSAPSPTAPDVFSTTNVQVAGVDELDIFKFESRDASKLYVLSGPTLNFLNAFPADKLGSYATADTMYASGIYEHGDSVISISYNKIEAFSKADGKASWHMNLNSSYLDSRMADGIIYVVLQEYPQWNYRPMPLERCAGANVKCMPLVIDYPDIFIPRGISSQVFYDVIAIDAATGDVVDAQSFMGPYSTTLYLSGSNIYVAMSEQKSQESVMFGYLLTDGRGILPGSLQSRLDYVNSLDISEDAKVLEFTIALQKYSAGLTAEEQSNFFNDVQKGYDAYVDKYPERLEYTAITRIPYSSGTFGSPASGMVPGHLLNSYSLDEFNGNLRAAITYGGWDSSKNGVLVLDSNMGERGRVVGLAEGERIYAVRFMGDKGYVVTFRQVDPLFVLDLSNPSSPKVAGELKVPGYSTYLHPVGNNQLLGIGQEDSKVKLSLFDVSDAANPRELDTYALDQYWSEALYNPHAFLYYPQKSLAVLPMGGSADYVFKVADGRIRLDKILTESAQRNAYADNVLYVINYEDVVAYSLTDYSEIARVKLEGSQRYWDYPYPGVMEDKPMPVEPDGGIGSTPPSAGSGSSGSTGSAVGPLSG